MQPLWIKSKGSRRPEVVFRLELFPVDDRYPQLTAVAKPHSAATRSTSGRIREFAAATQDPDENEYRPSAAPADNPTPAVCEGPDLADRMRPARREADMGSAPIGSRTSSARHQRQACGAGQSDNYSEANHFISSASSCHTGLRFGALVAAGSHRLKASCFMRTVISA